MTYLPFSSPSVDSIQMQLLRYAREAAASRAPLPGELELTARLGCTRQQLRNAMAGLERQGIVRRRQGTVTTVDPIALRMSVRLEEQFEHTDLLNRLGYRAEVDVLSSETITIPSHIAALMELPTDTLIASARKRWRADGQVAMIAHNSLPLPGAIEVDPAESIFDAIARIHGEAVVWEVTTPGLARLDETLAAQFEREVGEPVMTFEFVGIGASGKRLLHSMEYHDPQLVSYSMVRTARPPWA
ncbi:GntR family transcriptional regulator [Demequina capsici]|uniref:GntR family transcriptional regulator n=1 Tax=Demequina capsici TaxID=3075620 RepID=A0AA96FD42_9MICO|nr:MULTISPECIES: GntR family transcriptional regulator [unclassified Demequina]WNM23459.1 GntR family transcriptional regulator [Demequina sp. OYTSA14]WNM26336.1 GntR family transcriptional regulator [Demequina sp. PMTSA13]